MFAHSFIGKPIKALPADALKAPVVAITEVEGTRDLNDGLNRIKRTLGTAGGNPRYLIIAVRV
jgi:hypothetical protein